MKKVVVMHRSQLLPGFDQTCAHLVGSHMEDTGTRFMQDTQPLSIEKVKRGENNDRFLVKYKTTSAAGISLKEGEEEFDLVFSAVGRAADVQKLGLEKAGVLVHKDTKQVVTRNENKAQSNVDHM
jgi:pyruvate/2-oxoglutarate dehydrogenase complex dihydrolipoamide dehydrogenase (E3) component